MGLALGLKAEVKSDKANYNYELDLTGVKTFDDFKKLIKKGLIYIATNEFEAEKQKGFDSKPRIRVDNSFSKAIQNVKPFGRIEFIARFADIVEPIRKAYDIIVERSPVVTGLYRKLNWVYFNNKKVATDRRTLLKFLEKQQEKGFKNNDLLSFVNVAPYARKLERYGVRRTTQGRNAGMHRSKRKIKGNVLKPNGTYVVAKRSIERVLKGIAHVSDVKFLPIDVQVGAMRNRFKKDGRLYVYPTIDIRISSSGLKKDIIQ